MNFPAFSEKKFKYNKENNSSEVYVIEDVAASAFAKYSELLVSDGYEKKEETYRKGHRYASYLGEDAVYLNYFDGTRELYIAIDKDIEYFSFTSPALPYHTQPEITQLELLDFGMSYVVRLSDGRFIIFDGGRLFDKDVDRLYAHLKSRCVTEVPTIAAWIMTHPHVDHFELFIGFYDKYGDEVKIESFIHNFPEHDDLAHYPSLADSELDRFDYDNSSMTRVPQMLERIALSGAAVYTAHTGQQYNISDAHCEILACIDDTVHLSTNINATSLVIRMELGGQVILWTADASFEIARLKEKHGEHLKADILQIPHHGFGSGAASAEIEGYNIIKPSVCMLPVSEYNAFTTFCTFRGGTRYIMRDSGIDELIVATPTRTIALPYTAPAYAKTELREKYLAGLDNCGAPTWIFNGLSTSDPDDFVFTFFNSANTKAIISADIFFEDAKKRIRYVKIEIPATSIKTLSIVGDEVDGDAVGFNWLSLKIQGIPENVNFSVRFIANVPVVVSHKKHTASYHSQNR